MSDLYDDARAFRDAAMKEFERVLDPATPEPIIAGYRVGLNLVAILMTATAQRIGGLAGPVQAEGLLHFVGVAIAQTLALGATAYRPMLADGQPMPAAQNLVYLGNIVAQIAMHEVQMQEQGLQDFFVPFEMKPDGSLVAKTFDFQDMLNKGGAA